jgi:RNA polymerase-binding transcription factor DksA
MKPKIKFPKKVLAPVKKFLSKEERKLKKRKAQLSQEDPFEDSRRVNDNAAPDTEAEEQIGHERTVALKKEVDKKLIQVRKALTQIKLGRYGTCEKCSRMIDTDRLMVMPEATVCVKCEQERAK